MFTTDSRTERFLDEIGAKWEYTNGMTFERLEDGWGTENLGRSQAKIEAAIESYGALADRGSQPPAPILWAPQPTMNHKVLDGVQRLLMAERRNPASFSAYRVNTDSEAMAKRIRVFANYRLHGGYQESAEWTLEHAVTLLLGAGEMTLEEVADLGGWTQSVVRDKKQVVDFRHAIHGVGGPERLTDSIVRVIAKHAAREDFAAAPAPLAGFFNNIQRMQLSAAEAEPYVEQFFSVARSKGKLFDQFSAKLTTFRADEDVAARLADPTRKRYQPMTAEGRVLRALKAALTTAQRVLDSGEPIHDMAEYFQTVGQIRKILQQIERISKTAKR
jgi:hypothetical protein